MGLQTAFPRPRPHPAICNQLNAHQFCLCCPSGTCLVSSVCPVSLGPEKTAGACQLTPQFQPCSCLNSLLMLLPPLTTKAFTSSLSAIMCLDRDTFGKQTLDNSMASTEQGFGCLSHHGSFIFRASLEQSRYPADVCKMNKK